METRLLLANEALVADKTYLARSAATQDCNPEPLSLGANGVDA
jgi:hypothetical protein